DRGRQCALDYRIHNQRTLLARQMPWPVYKRWRTRPLAWFDLPDRRRNIELRWRDQNRVALHRLCGNSDGKEDHDCDCGKKTFANGVRHYSPPWRAAQASHFASFAPERKLLMAKNSERPFER